MSSAVVRRAINDPNNRHLEEIAVPGGVLLGIRTTVWSRRVMPDPVVIPLASRQPGGVEAWITWLAQQRVGADMAIA